MADDHPIPAYPLMFDSSQWSNKYSDFANKKLPFMGLMAANAPTDALGRPIQSYLDAQAQHDAWAKANPAPAAPGKTLNSPAWDSNGNANAPGSNLNPMGDWSALAPALPGASPQAQANYARDLGLGGAFGANAQQGGGGAQVAAAPGAQAATPAAAPTNPYDMNQAYLTALANPGKVTTPGATVAQSAPPSNQSGVLQQFLANWDKGGQQTKGAGNYDNSGFINSLRGMV